MKKKGNKREAERHKKDVRKEIEKKGQPYLGSNLVSRICPPFRVSTIPSQMT